MTNSFGSNFVFGLIATAALAVGVLWFFVSGALWQFVPILGALVIGNLIRKAMQHT